MSVVTVTTDGLTEIAEAIREKNPAITGLIPFTELASMILKIPSGTNIHGVMRSGTIHIDNDISDNVVLPIDLTEAEYNNAFMFIMYANEWKGRCSLSGVHFVPLGESIGFGVYTNYGGNGLTGSTTYGIFKLTSPTTVLATARSSTYPIIRGEYTWILVGLPDKEVSLYSLAEVGDGCE